MFCLLAKISVSSGSQKVNFGEGFFLESWAKDAQVKTDKGAPKNGFSFNNSVLASSVVSQLIQGQYLPGRICF